jgi:hypothetical protein
MLNRAYRHWIDSLNFFLNITHSGHALALDLLSERYQFHRPTIWIVQYAVFAPVWIASLFFFMILLPDLIEDDSIWYLLPWLAFNLLVFTPFMLWLSLKLGIIKRKSNK